MLIVVGTNHKYCPLEIREKLSFSKKKVKEALFSLVGQKGVLSAVILSTCNRVEIYAHTTDAQLGIKTSKEFLAQYHRQDLGEIEPYLYVYIGKEAVIHLFEVSAGLDSQIIGESQILEQIRTVYAQARQMEVTDGFLDTVFLKAQGVALRVRQETRVCAGEISLASIVAELVKSRYVTLKDKKVLIIGGGKISESVARFLKEENAETVFVANRTFEKAVQLAQDMGIEAVRFDKLKEKLKEAEIVISATSSPHSILKKEDIWQVIDSRPLLLIDLAVPRDIDPQVRYIKGVTLFCLEDLDFIIEKKIALRKQEIPHAEKIIEQEVENLWIKGYCAWEHAGVPWP